MADQVLQQLIKTAQETSFRMETMALVTAAVSPVPSLHSPEEPSPIQPDSIATPPDWQSLPPDTRTSVRGNSASRRGRRRRSCLRRRCVENQARNRVGSVWTISPIDSRFYGTVNIEEKLVAHNFAQTFSNRGSSLDHMIFWIGVSGQEGQPFGYSIAMKFQGGRWKCKLGPAANPRGVDHGYMLAIQLALEAAVRHAKAFYPSQPSITVKIFTDSQAVLKKLRSLPFIEAHGTMQALAEVLDTLKHIAQLSETLVGYGVKLELFWAPESCNIAGQMVAKSTATDTPASPNNPVEGDSIVAVPGTSQSQTATGAELSGSSLRIEVEPETCDSESSDDNVSDVAERGPDITEVNETKTDVSEVERAEVVEKKQTKASKRSWWERITRFRRSS